MYSVKNVKSFIGREGYGFNASLYKDNKKVAFVIDSGNGGETSITWVDFKEPKVEVSGTNYMNEAFSYKGTPFEKEFQDFLNSLPHKTYPVSSDIYIGSLVDLYEENKQLKRWCKKETLFSVKGDKKGGYRTIKHPYGDVVKKHLTDKYGDDLKEIINERFVVAL